MKKVLIFLIALLGCLYSVNAVENEEYEVIVVQHRRTKKWVVEDTLFGDDIRYTENKAVKYAAYRIPEKFVDRSEEYYIYNKYYDVGKKNMRVYRYKLWNLYSTGYSRYYTRNYEFQKF